MAAGNGYIRIFRSLFANPIWKCNTAFDIRSAFIDMIQRAAYQPMRVIRNGAVIEIGVGEFVASQDELCADWNCGRSTVRKYIDLFRSLGSLTTRKTSNATIYKLPNYADLNGILDVSAPTDKPAQKPALQPMYLNNKINKKERNTPPYNPPKNGRISEEIPQKEGENGAKTGVFASKRGESGAPQGRVEERGLCAYAAPSRDEWYSYAESIGWSYPEEYEQSYNRFEATKNSRGEWLDGKGNSIRNWRAMCESCRNSHDRMQRRKRNNFRPIPDCLDDDVEPAHWRIEYARQFKLADVSEVDRCYESFAALKLANRSLAALILTRCIKGYAEDRAQFRTEYPAEMSIERLKEAYKYCVNYNDAMRDETSEDRAVLAAQSIEEIHAASPLYYERICELAKAPPFRLAQIFKELAL